MWKRDEAVKPTVPAGSGQTPAPSVGAPPAAEAARTPTASSEPQRGMEKTTVNIGKSVVIKGELSGSEDLTIEGQVEGKIELKDHALTIGPNGKIKAQVFAKSVIVLGEVNGNVTATEKVDIRDGGSVDGDIVSPRVAIADSDVPNAFATGRSPKDAVVCATTGIMRRLEPAELLTFEHLDQKSDQPSGVPVDQPGADSVVPGRGGSERGHRGAPVLDGAGRTTLSAIVASS